MTTLYQRIRLLATDDRGQDLVEYALLAGFISIVAILALQAIGPLVEGMYDALENVLDKIGRCCD